jgi:hypothetical protein
MKRHGGTSHAQGVLNKGTAPKPNPDPVHGGSGARQGVTHSPKPQVYGTHGGTNLPRKLNKRK